MADTYTTNLSLKKPGYDSPADIMDINDNMDKLDKAAGGATSAAAEATKAAQAANAAAERTETAISNANAATKKANDAADTATTAAGSATSASVTANSAAEQATSAATEATEAAADATEKAGLADTAATKAEASAAKANTAATNADTATGKANTATSNANTAATNASNAANLIKNMTVTVSKVAAGGTPTATLTTVANPDHYSLNIGVVTGDTGKTGATGSVGPKGDTGAAAGFGAITATVDNKVGTPSVEVTKGGPATATTLNFAFHNLKGNTGEIGNITVNGKGPDASGNFTVEIPKLYTTTGTAADGAMTQKAVTDALNTKANSSALSSYVPTTRKVNSKALSTDISLTAADVGALPSTTTIPKLYTTTGTAADGAMTQKAVTDALNAKANSSALSHYLATSGGTMIGKITLYGTSSNGGQAILYDGATSRGSTPFISVYTGDEYGNGLVIGDGGRTIIGGGESAASLRTALGTATSDEASEEMHVANDGAVLVHTNCQTITARKTFTFGADGVLTAPGGFKGSLNGNATSATTATSAGKLSTARTFPAVNLAGTGTASFDGSANPTALGVSGTLPIAHGGTGATVAGTALSNLGGVPTTRKVNNKALSADISLSAGDVGAVPTSRKVNGQTLDKDITINMPDIEYNTVDLEAGTSPLETGKIYLVYE